MRNLFLLYVTRGKHSRSLAGGAWRRLAWVGFRSFVIPTTVFLAASLTTLLTSSGITFGQPVAAPSGAAGQLSEIDKLIETKRLQEAGDRLQQEIRAHGESYGTLFLEAKLFFREQKYQDSLKVLERCLALNQQDPEAYKLVASNAIVINRMDIAEQALKAAAKLAPNDYLVYFHLGALYYTDSRFPQAQPPLMKSLDLNPDYVPARLFLGLTLEELGQEQSAIDSYRLAIKVAERSGFKGEQPYLYLGRLLYRQNRIDDSLTYLQKAVEANPQSCESLCLLARGLLSKSREAGAITALNQCRRSDPRYPEAHYLLSRIYLRQGKTEEAARELALFQKLKGDERDRKDPRKNQRGMP
jgi:tetratricopeptide (TPR) repeat protein